MTEETQRAERQPSSFLEEFVWEYIRLHHQAPSMVEIWLALEARSSLTIDRDERAQTITIEEA